MALFERRDPVGEFHSTRAGMLAFGRRFMGLWGFLLFFALWNMGRQFLAGLPPLVAYTTAGVFTVGLYWRLWKMWRLLGEVIAMSMREADEQAEAHTLALEERRRRAAAEWVETSAEERAVIDELRAIVKDTDQTTGEA